MSNYFILPQPMCLILDLIRNHRWIFRLPKGGIPLKLMFCLLATAFLIGWRLWMQNFESPKFKVMDNPVAAVTSIWTKVTAAG